MNRPQKDNLNIPPFLKEDKEGIMVFLYVQPNAAKTCLAGLHNNKLKLRIQAPPVNGAANKACKKFLAKKFKISKNSVILKKGSKSREKIFCLKGVDLTQIMSKI